MVVIIFAGRGCFGGSCRAWYLDGGLEFPGAKPFGSTNAAVAAVAMANATRTKPKQSLPILGLFT